MMRSRRRLTVQSGPRATPLTYGSYIRSDAWHRSAARLGEIEAASRQCRLCDRGEPEVILTVHHRTYANLGRELQRDLTCLCLGCHVGVTSMLSAAALAVERLPDAQDVPAALPGRILRDSINDGGAR